MQGVKRYRRERTKKTAPKEVSKPSVTRQKEKSSNPQISKPLIPSVVAQAPTLDRRTDMRLSRGQIRPEAKLDLHGLSRIQSEGRLSGFLKQAQEEGKRCVIVITGKGSLSNPAVLRLKVPEWLRDNPLVLKVAQAQPKDGGAGAFYVYLKRTRTSEP